MTDATQALLEQALRLTPSERSELAAALLRADDLADAWRPELDRRRSDLDRGNTPTLDARAAIDSMRARLRPTDR